MKQDIYCNSQLLTWSMILWRILKAHNGNVDCRLLFCINLYTKLYYIAGGYGSES